MYVQYVCVPTDDDYKIIVAQAVYVRISNSLASVKKQLTGKNKHIHCQ